MLIFFNRTAVKGPRMSKMLIRIIKLTFAMIALVIGIHNNFCLTLSQTFTLYNVYNTFKTVTKSLKSC